MKFVKYIAIVLMIYSFNNSYTMSMQEKLAQASVELAKNSDQASKAAQVIMDALKEVYSNINRKFEYIKNHTDEIGSKWAKWEQSEIGKKLVGPPILEPI